MNEEAQSSNASARLVGDMTAHRAQIGFDTTSLIVTIERMGVTIDQSAMRADSTVSRPFLDDSFLRVPDSVWSVVADRQQRYRKFGGVGVQFRLQKNPSFPPGGVTTGLNAGLVRASHLHDAIFNLVPVTRPGFNSAHAIDRAILGQLAPRITKQGKDAQYPAMLKTILRMAFDVPSLGQEIFRGSHVMDERDFARTTLKFLANHYVSNPSRTLPVGPVRQDAHRETLEVAQQIGERGVMPFVVGWTFFQEAEKNLPGYSGQGLYIVRDLNNTATEQSHSMSGTSQGYYGYFEGPIVSVDGTRGSVRQNVRDSRGYEYEREHVGLTEHMLQRIEVIRKGWVNEPVALELINRMTQVTPLECAQLLSLDAAYASGIIPPGAGVLRVNATLQDKTFRGEAYEGQFLGATAHHIYLKNNQGGYEAHLKCLFTPNDLAMHTSNAVSSDANLNLKIDYFGAMHGARIRPGRDTEIGFLRTVLNKMKRRQKAPQEKLGSYMLGPLSLDQSTLLHEVAVRLLGHAPHEILNPTQAMSRSALADAASGEVRAAILGDEHDGTVWGRFPGDGGRTTPGGSELGSGSDVEDLFSLGSPRDLEHRSPVSSSASSVSSTPKAPTRENSPVASGWLSSASMSSRSQAACRSNPGR